MPLIKKLLIFAAAEGLVLQPINLRDRTPEGNPVQISWSTKRIITRQTSGNEEEFSDGLESYGIVGLLDLSKPYLISITRRDLVATIRKSPIYTIKDVTFIPLSSQEEAAEAIHQAQQGLSSNAGNNKGDETDESDIEEDFESMSIGDDDKPAETETLEPPKRGVVRKSASVVKDVIQQKGRYGRFAKSWFSRGGGWTASGRRSQGLSSEEDLSKQAERRATATGDDDGLMKDPDRSMSEAKEDSDPTDKSTTSGAIEALTPRIIRSTKLYFSSSSFYFSYDYDLSASLANQEVLNKAVPLWRRFNLMFFWNRHLISTFIQAGQYDLVLPIIQGFVGQRAFSIAKTDGSQKDVVANVGDRPSELEAAQKAESPEDADETNFLLTLVSRRSTKRAGLRYLRRGIDDDGNAANFVETEQLLAMDSAATLPKGFSLVQIRGSIPLFFSQSPYSFKPLPELRGSTALNHEAFRKHFAKLKPYYGSVYCVSLVDKHATEVKIGETYEQHAKQFMDEGGYGDKTFAFEWFDFHGACKGMKFENVSILLDTLQQSLDSFGWTERQHGKVVKQQTGVLRTNCMDCLDRTNVVQSAVAGQILQKQLAELGLDIDLQKDPKTQWFNTLWADNGDAISRQYAGTAALKGDFTRTRKRNWTGAISDFSLTLNRYFNNIFGDYFLQTVIDYQLGNENPSVFDEFQTDMMSKDYAVDMHRVRQNAIDSCVRMVLENPQDEDLVAGWTLACPLKPNTLHTLPFEECVLLLTSAALYFCRFDWNTEKVNSFERVDLTGIKAIWRGAYITSTLGEAHLDEQKNAGFAVRYELSKYAIMRSNSRSMQNEEIPGSENEGKTELAKQREPEKSDSRLLAFKVLPPQASAAAKEDDGLRRIAMSESGLAKEICDQIRSTLVAAHQRLSGTDHLQLNGEIPSVEERDVISAAEARKSTGYLESIGYNLKKLVW